MVFLLQSSVAPVASESISQCERPLTYLRDDTIRTGAQARGCMYDGRLEDNGEAYAVFDRDHAGAQSLKHLVESHLRGRNLACCGIGHSAACTHNACGPQKSSHAPRTTVPATPLSRGQTRVFLLTDAACFLICFRPPRLLFSSLSRRRASSLSPLLPGLSPRSQALSDAPRRHVDVLQVLGRPRVGHIARDDDRSRHAYPRTGRVTRWTSPPAHHQRLAEARAYSEYSAASPGGTARPASWRIPHALVRLDRFCSGGSDEY
jgi:hypothetical protein